jgi:hypothetical protein
MPSASPGERRAAPRPLGAGVDAEPDRRRPRPGPPSSAGALACRLGRPQSSGIDGVITTARHKAIEVLVSRMPTYPARRWCVAWAGCPCLPLPKGCTGGRWSCGSGAELPRLHDRLRGDPDGQLHSQARGEKDRRLNTGRRRTAASFHSEGYLRMDAEAEPAYYRNVARRYTCATTNCAK